MIEMYYSSLCRLLAFFPSNLFLRSYIYNFERGGGGRGGRGGGGGYREEMLLFSGNRDRLK